MPNTPGQQSSGLEDTLSNTNGVTNPGATTDIATVTVPAGKGGMYEIQAIAGYGGTADVVDNMGLYINGVQKIVLPVIASANAVRVPVVSRFRVLAGQAIAIKSIAASAASTIYRATVVAKKVDN